MTAVVSPTNVLLVGVGGQGIVLAGEILARAALLDGLDAKKSEIHGMSQRGGSVVSHVRFGARVYSPVIPAGQADVLLAFEQLEALRAASHLKPGGLALVNSQTILPAPVLAGLATYPQDVAARLAAAECRATFLDAASLAQEAGHPLTANVALLGALAARLSLSDAAWEAALSEHIKPAFLEANRRAFHLGRKATRD